MCVLHRTLKSYYFQVESSIKTINISLTRSLCWGKLIQHTNLSVFFGYHRAAKSKSHKCGKYAIFCAFRKVRKTLYCHKSFNFRFLENFTTTARTSTKWVEKVTALWCGCAPSSYRSSLAMVNGESWSSWKLCPGGSWFQLASEKKVLSDGPKFYGQTHMTVCNWWLSTWNTHVYTHLPRKKWWKQNCFISREKGAT